MKGIIMRIRMRNFVRFLIVFIIFTIVVVIVMDKVVMPLYIRHGEKFIMMDVRQKQFGEAKAILAMNGLEVEVVDTVDNSDLLPGTVVDQQPPPGYDVKKGRVIRLVVTGGEKYFQMPNLVGKVLKAAGLEMDHYKLVVDSVIYQYSTDKPKGVVSEQSVPQGVMISSNELVILTVSKGQPPRQLEVPDLFGLNLEGAKRAIRKSGFRMGMIRYIPNPELNPYTVIGQEPKKGELRDKPVTIDLEVTTTDVKQE